MKRSASPLAPVSSCWRSPARATFAVGAGRAQSAGRLGTECLASQPRRTASGGGLCAMRQGHHSEAMRDLDVAGHAASSPKADGSLRLRVETWRAELAYFQGRYSVANEIVDRLLDRLEQSGDWAYAAFALRIRIAILLARTDYEGVAAQAERALSDAKASGDDYVMVQILNILGAFHFDRATWKLPERHARAHLSSPTRATPRRWRTMHARRCACFEHARAAAERARTMILRHGMWRATLSGSRYSPGPRGRCEQYGNA